MRLYVVQQFMMADNPGGAKAEVYYNRELAAKAWLDHVLEDLDYPGGHLEFISEGDVELLNALAVDWSNDPDHPDPEWVCFGETAPPEEQITHRIDSVEVPNLQVVYQKR